MKSIRKAKVLVADFETTVYEGQKHTEVWASACVELNTEDVHIFHSIDEQFEYLKSLKTNVICYFHNIKFDGEFWMSYLLTVLEMEQGILIDEDDISKTRFVELKELKNNQFIYNISDTGTWYRFMIKVNNHIIEIRDSLKLLPFKVKEIGNGFKTKHQKLDMEYVGFRYAGCEITDEEREYIANDVLVVKEALETMFAEGHTRLTIGACCLAEYKRIMGDLYKLYFPNLYDDEVNASCLPQFVTTDSRGNRTFHRDQFKAVYGAPTIGDYIRMSYHGGWCYVAKGKEMKQYHNGTTADVNSLYPSMMSSESGNCYPIGLPTFWKGDIPSTLDRRAQSNDIYYFVRIRTRFYLKTGKLPFIQQKNSLLYKFTEMLETSDVKGSDGKYYKFKTDEEGNSVPTSLTLTMTMTDYKLFREHYNVEDFEVLDGCWFRAKVGIFDEYIDKYKKIKLESKGAMRTLAKLFLNNLYGKLASNTNSSFKVAYVKPDKTIGYFQVPADDKEPGYIPCGSAITSYARNFTIRCAQANYHGVNERGFIYADTDSIHCDLQPNELVGLKVHDKDFCCWKLESCWDVGYFTRQKTYIEHVTHEDLEPIEEPYYNVKCAGMPPRCKELFLRSMSDTPYTEDETDGFNDDEKDFMRTKRTIDDFRVGLRIPSKLVPKRIRGGVVLTPTTYEMR